MVHLQIAPPHHYNSAHINMNKEEKILNTKDYRGSTNNNDEKNIIIDNIIIIIIIIMNNILHFLTH